MHIAICDDDRNDLDILIQLVREYCASNGADVDEKERIVYAIKAIIFGMTAMMESGELENMPKTYEYIRVTIEKELD